MSLIQEILLPVDFSERCRRAAYYARHIARRFQARVTLLHVQHVTCAWHDSETSGLSYVDLVEDLPEYTRSQMEAFLREEFEGIPTSRVVMEGDAAGVIVQYAHANACDLVVVPTHGYGPVRRWLLGSTTAKILHDCDRPVLTGVHLEEAPPQPEFRPQHIVCAVRLGETNAGLVSFASQLAQAYVARLTLLHVLPPLEWLGRSPEQASAAAAQRRDEALEKLRQLQRVSAVTAELHLIHGKVPQTLVEEVAALGADLLFVGRTHAKGVLGRLRYLSYEIIRESPVPVISL